MCFYQPILQMKTLRPQRLSYLSSKLGPAKHNSGLYPQTLLAALQPPSSFLALGGLDTQIPQTYSYLALRSPRRTCGQAGACDCSMEPVVCVQRPSSPDLGAFNPGRRDVNTCPRAFSDDGGTQYRSQARDTRPLEVLRSWQCVSLIPFRSCVV